MKMKIVLFLLVINLVINSFAVCALTQSNQLPEEKSTAQPLQNKITQDENLCNCNSKNDYAPSQDGLTSEDIAALTEQGKTEGWTFTVGQNPATKYSLDSLCGLEIGKEDYVVKDDGVEPLNSYPAKFDWRDPSYNPEGRNCLTPIKDQGGCGACWAFSATGAIESSILIKDEDTVDLSEQWIISCNTAGDDCNGGYATTAFSHYTNQPDECGAVGGVLEADFPYEGNNGPCNCPHPRSYKLNTYHTYGSNPSVDQIKQAIMTYGPVAVSIYASGAFQGYSGGIFNNNESGSLNHGVVLVGWDDNQGANGIWFLRNSFGDGWGESGYMRIQYYCCRVGEFAKSVDYGQSWAKKTKYGNQWYSITGDWSNYGSHSVRMSPGGSSCTAEYKFVLDYNYIPSTLHVGVYFCDWGTWPFADGPSVYIYNWNTQQYDLLHQDIADWDVLRWVWMGTFSSTNYVHSSTGYVFVKVYAEDLDDTILDTVSIKHTPPVENLDCIDANLNWNNVAPGATVTGSFKVKNIGQPGSKLDWAVDSYPTWGTWTFNPSSGTDLTPEQNPVTVQVSVVAPNQAGQSYSGEVWVRNSNKYTDYCTMSTSLSTTGSGNEPPNMPNTPTPSNGATGVSINTDLYWQGGDPDSGDNVYYDIYFGTSSDPPYYDTTPWYPGTQTSISYDLTTTLSYNTNYYWRIVAYDSMGGYSGNIVWGFTTGSQSNNAPYEPSDPSPDNHSTGVDVNTVISWTGGDPDPDDTVRYGVYFGPTNPPDWVEYGVYETSWDPPGSLNYGTKYYWQICAWDNHNPAGITWGPVWDFTTVAEPNNPPYVPSAPSPADHETDVKTNVHLSWTGGDPDGDAVTYNVYFGLNAAPPCVSSNQPGTSWDPGELNPYTRYFWKIVAIDYDGASTSSLIWEFTTGAHTNSPPNVPNDPTPFDGAKRMPKRVSLVWDGGDPDSDDTVTYTIKLTWINMNIGDEKVYTVTAPADQLYCIECSLGFDLKRGTKYMWEVVATDDDGEITRGPSWEFTTSLFWSHSYDSHPVLSRLVDRLLERYPRAFPILRHLLGV